jgi:predicted porin
MNKKLVTLAVAAAMVAPAAAMADAVLYGKLNVGINYVDQDYTLLGQPGFEGWGLSDNQAVRPLVSPFITTPQGPANRVGVKGSEDLGNGLKAIYQIELGVSMSDSANTPTSGNDPITMRNSFVGLAGGWGTFLLGRHDTPLKISTGPLDLFADTLADYNNTVGFQDIRADNAIAYISPSFSGFTFAAAVHAGGGACFAGSTGCYSPDVDSLAEAYSFAGIYKNGPWYASLAYEGLNQDMGVVIAGPDAETWGKWRVGLGILNWNGFTLTGIYENWQDALWTEDQDADLWNIQAGYTFGNFMVKAAYGDSNVGDTLWDDENDTSQDYNWTTWSFGLDYNMSKRTKAFLLYTDNAADDLCDADNCSTDWQGFQLGMMHTF